MRPSPIRGGVDGFHCKLFVYEQDTVSITALKSAVGRLRNNGTLAFMFKNHWNLASVPIISNVEVLHASKKKEIELNRNEGNGRTGILTADPIP